MVSLKHLRKDKTNVSKTFVVAIILMGMLLNQSDVIFEVNMSFADVFCLIIFLILFFKNKLSFPLVHTMFFLATSIIVLFTAVFIVPNNFSFTPEVSRIIIDYSKLIVVFVYFIIGYNISKLNQIERILKWYSGVALLIGGIGIAFTILKIKIFPSLFYGIRFRGLMNDPNYFSILQITALCYFVRTKTLHSYNKILCISLMLFSVIVSGSKTGILTLLCYLILLVLDYIFYQRKKARTVICAMTLAIGLIILIPMSFNFILSMIDYISNIIPAFARILVLFENFNVAVSGGGSGRDNTWQSAFEIIKLSPIVGVGIGTYSGVADLLTGSRALAHNTYLQLLAEWGIPLTMIFFNYLFWLIINTIKVKNVEDKDIVLRDMIIVFVVGSFAISLNNARMFWLCLGSIVWSFNRNRNKKETSLSINLKEARK